MKSLAPLLPMCLRTLVTSVSSLSLLAGAVSAEADWLVQPPLTLATAALDVRVHAPGLRSFTLLDMDPILLKVPVCRCAGGWL